MHLLADWPLWDHGSIIAACETCVSVAAVAAAVAAANAEEVGKATTTTGKTPTPTVPKSTHAATKGPIVCPYVVQNAVRHLTSTGWRMLTSLTLNP